MNKAATAVSAMLAAALTLTNVGAPAAARSSGPAHSCRGLPHLRPGPHVLTDRRSENSALVRGIDELICSAADHSRIEIKTYFIYDVRSDPAVRGFIAHAHLMHRYHHVTVSVLLGSTYYRHTHRPFGAVASAFAGWASLAVCRKACRSAAPTGVTHAKWVTVSRLRGGGSAVLALSANWTQQQLARQIQSGVLIIGSRPVYQAVAHRFATYWRCATGGRCDKRVPRRTAWIGPSRLSVSFTPVVLDPVAAELRAVQCQRGGRILMTTVGFGGSALVRALRAKQAQGCRVRVNIEHPRHVRPLATLGARCLVVHDKALVIDTPGLREVIAGSTDFSIHAHRSNDNVLVRARNARAVQAYEALFAFERAQTHRCRSLG